MKQLENFAEVHETILILSYKYLNYTMHLQKGHKSFEYLEMLLIFAQFLEKTTQVYGLDKILFTAIPYALKLGILH